MHMSSWENSRVFMPTAGTMQRRAAPITLSAHSSTSSVSESLSGSLWLVPETGEEPEEKRCALASRFLRRGGFVCISRAYKRACVMGRNIYIYIYERARRIGGAACIFKRALIFLPTFFPVGAKPRPDIRCREPRRLTVSRLLASNSGTLN